ncbi:hypothetical protein LO772_06310 [Yinghuangia sp. ASG 101]|uniref:tetratricopeptide repeat protein n=1 Tax=Yinghuangia sp. ASG 101 TaxID=2896848 RepID=UPI001E51262A|nr:tetratricopeptide repeat protein [Yinghuangia sp. ASG 101]UGQ13227.1 hypothetical protein LO772_06310 [Yinghuangia sp. ASG 101]
MRFFDTDRAPDAEEAERQLAAAVKAVQAGRPDTGRKRYEKLAQRLAGVAGREDQRGRALAGAAAVTAQLGDREGAVAAYRAAFPLLTHPAQALPEWVLRFLAHEQVVAERPELAPVLAFLAGESTHPLATAVTEWVQQWCRSGDDAVTGATVAALPRTEWAVLARASALRGAGRLGEAEALLAAARCPPTDELAFAHGVVLTALNRHPEAVRAFTLALGRPRAPHGHPWSRGPRLPGEALLYRGLAREAAGDPAGAAEDLAEAAGRSPDDPRPLYALGAAALRAGRDGEARPRFEAVLAIDPDHTAAHLGLALAHERAGRPAEAAAAYRTAGADLPGVGVRLACVLTACGRPDEALALWPEAPAPGAAPTDWDATEPPQEDAFHLAAAYFAAGDHDRAARLWAVSAPRNVVLAWDRRARAALAADRVDEARELWRRCVAADTATAYRRALGEAAFRVATRALVARDTDTADEALREVASLLGDEVRVRSARAALALLRNRPHEASSLLAAVKGRPRDRYHLAVAGLADARPTRTLALLDGESTDPADVRLRAVLASRAGNWQAALDGYRLCLRALRPRAAREFATATPGAGGSGERRTCGGARDRDASADGRVSGGLVVGREVGEEAGGATPDSAAETRRSEREGDTSASGGRAVTDERTSGAADTASGARRSEGRGEPSSPGEGVSAADTASGARRPDGRARGPSSAESAAGPAGAPRSVGGGEPPSSGGRVSGTRTGTGARGPGGRADGPSSGEWAARSAGVPRSEAGGEPPSSGEGMSAADTASGARRPDGRARGPSSGGWGVEAAGAGAWWGRDDAGASAPECRICGRCDAAFGVCRVCGAALLDAGVAAARAAGLSPGLLLAGWDGTALEPEAARLRALLLAEEGELDAALALLEPGHPARAPVLTRRAAAPGRPHAAVLADLREAADLPGHHPGVDAALAVLGEEVALSADADGEPARAAEVLRSVLRERGTADLPLLHSLAIAAHRAATAAPTADQWDWALGCWAAVLRSPAFRDQVAGAVGRAVDAAQWDTACDAVAERLRQDLAAWDASRDVPRDTPDAAEVRWGREWEAARLAAARPGLVAGPRLLDLLAGHGVPAADARRTEWRNAGDAEGAALFGPLGTAHYLIGRGRPEAAAAVLRTQADENIAGARELLASTLVAVAREHHRHREWAQALAVLSEAGAHTPETAELASAAGVNAAREWLSENSDDQPGAVDILERARHLAPDDAGLRENLAAAYLQFGRKINNEQKDYARAVDLMRKARSLTAEPSAMDHEFVAVLGNLAWQRVGEGKPGRRQLALAAPVFAQIAAITRAEDDLLNATGVFARLAHACAEDGDRSEAVAAMRRSIDHDPEWGGGDRERDARTRLSRYFQYKLVENQDAPFRTKHTWLDQAAEYDAADTAPAFGMLLHNEGVAHADRKNFATAADLLRRALEATADTVTRQQLAQVLAAWAVSQANNGEWRSAHRNITEALRHDPRDFHVRLLADQIETGLRRSQRR